MKKVNFLASLIACLLTYFAYGQTSDLHDDRPSSASTYLTSGIPNPVCTPISPDFAIYDSINHWLPDTNTPIKVMVTIYLFTLKLANSTKHYYSYKCKTTNAKYFQESPYAMAV
jgi:hypothetical protein